MLTRRSIDKMSILYSEFLWRNYQCCLIRRCIRKYLYIGMFYNKKNILRCLHLKRIIFLDEFQLISSLTEYFWGRLWNHHWQHNRGHFQCQFYIGEHLNAFSKYFIIIQYAYKYGASFLFSLINNMCNYGMESVDLNGYISIQDDIIAFIFLIMFWTCCCLSIAARRGSLWQRGRGERVSANISFHDMFSGVL